MDTEQIFEFFSDYVSGKKPNGKFQLARIYGACKREQERISKNKTIDEQLKDGHKKYSIHRISDDMAIVEYHEKMFGEDAESWFSPSLNDHISNNVYDSFDKALIALVAFKTDNIRASEYIFKMLDMESEVK